MAEEKTTTRTPVVVEEPLFRTDVGALMFALNFTHGTCKKPGLTALMGGAGKGRGLGGLDGAGQAGMIRAGLGAMTKIRQAILVARYATHSIPCSCRRPCCRGFAENPEWAEAVDVVTAWLLVQGACGTISHYRLRRALASRYFGVRVSFVDIAKQCGIDRDTASKYNKKAVELLKAEEKLARYEAEGILKNAGVVE